MMNLRTRLASHGLDALLVSSSANIRYLTGFTGSNALLAVTRKGAALITDSRYALQSAREARGIRRIIGSRGLFEDALEAGLLREGLSVGFESHVISYAQYRSLRRLFPGVSFRPTDDVVEDLACVKDRSELGLIARAAAISDRVYGAILSSIRPGVRELDIAAEISFLSRRHGSERDAFDVIVASGSRSALPHAQPTAKKLRSGDIVLLDFGAVVGGYNADLTRTVAVGSPPRRLLTAYHAVQEAHQRATEAARAGMRAKDLDRVARSCLEGHGLGKYFVHSLGHGLGLHVHERPRISWLSRDVLRVGSVITIEPGVYIPGVGGVRIEDVVLLGERGCRVLTMSPRELTIL